MCKYILKKLGNLIFILIGVSFLTFMMGRLAPGDPARTLLENENVEPTVEELEEAREFLGLNDPLLVQYGNWVGDVLKGDFGVSYKTGMPVLHEIKTRIPATLELAGMTMILIFVFIIPIGIFVGINRNKFVKKLINTLIFILMSIPTFAIGILLIMIFGVRLKLLPVMGRGEFVNIILPSVTLALGISAALIKFVGEEITEEKEKDYIYAAKGFGISKLKITFNLILKNVLVPIVTRLGLTLGGLLGGSAIIENMFAWPGTGSLLIQAIQGRDYPIIQCYALIMAILYLVINSIIDISYVFLDPRISNSEVKNEA